MDKLLEILESPGKNDFKFGLYLLMFRGKNGIYESYQNHDEFRVTKAKQKMFFEMNIPIDIIEELEDAVREVTNRIRNEDEADIDI